MNTPLVSIIVPVYNVENFLRECLDSVLAQTFTDFELLLIDDGSTDSSGVICDEYVGYLSNVRVFHKSNGGVSSARNVGLDNAKGEYVIFCDSDDLWIRKDTLSTLIKSAKENKIDIVRGEYVCIDKHGNKISNPLNRRNPKFYGRVLTPGEFLTECVKGEFFSFLWLIKREVIGNIRFNEHQSFLEDMRFLMEIAAQPLKCIYLDFPFYAYRKYESYGSFNTSVDKLRDSLGMIDFFIGIREKLSGELFRHHCERYAIMLYRWTLPDLLLDCYINSATEIITQLNLNELRIRCLNLAKKWKFKIPIQDWIVYLIPPVKMIKIIRLYRNIRYGRIVHDIFVIN